eukprot:11069229-Ditylum_brightwellii.AAC.1
MVFLPPGMDLSMFDTSPVPVLDSYVTYIDKFKYLGSYVTSDLSDIYDVKNRVIQANKAMASMMRHVFWNKSLSKHVKKLLYMAIPINLLYGTARHGPSRKQTVESYRSFTHPPFVKS